MVKDIIIGAVSRKYMIVMSAMSKPRIFGDCRVLEVLELMCYEPV